MEQIVLSVLVLGGAAVVIAATLAGIYRALTEWSSKDRRRVVGGAAVLLLAWFSAAILLSQSGFYSAANRKVPTIQYGLLTPILLGVLIYWISPAARRAAAAIPVTWLARIQVFRIEGGIFLVLLALGQLPAVFAIPAGTGDVLVGLFSFGVAASYAAQLPNSRRRLQVWNWLGITDLVVAVTTGFLSSPSRFQAFAFDNPNLLIGQFPLVLIPVFLVPLAILMHLLSLAQLRASAELDSIPVQSPRAFTSQLG
jgi:hypothetical protein